MAFKYEIWHEEPLIRVSVTGSPDYLSLDKLWHDIVATCEVHGCLKVLGESATEPLKDEEAYDHAAIFEAAGMSNLYRVAWVEKNEDALEKTKLAEAVVNNRDLVTGRAFDNPTEARRWLSEAG
jgi:hypothetical protein